MGAPARSERTTYRPGDPVDVAATLAPLQRGRRDPAQQRHGRVLWRASGFPVGPATLRLEQIGPREVGCEAWGPGAAAAIAAVPDLLGARDEPSSFAASHLLVAELHRRSPGLRMTRTGRVLEALVPAILEQRVPGITAFGAWRYLLERYGEPAPGPASSGMRVPPDAATWARIPEWEWHRAGVDPGRSRTARGCAARAARLEECTSMSGADAARRLRIMPGVGIWTAAEVTARALGDLDALSVGDYHLATVVGTALVGRPLDDDGMLEILEPYRPQRLRAIRLLEAGGGYAMVQRRGPRITLQDHRAH